MLNSFAIVVKEIAGSLLSINQMTCNFEFTYLIFLETDFDLKFPTLQMILISITN